MKILTLALCAVITGCAHDTKPVPEKTEADFCLEIIGKLCTTKEEKVYVSEQRDIRYKAAVEKYQDSIDKVNGEGKYAIVHAIEENTRTINNNLLWMRIENGMRR